jgi:hypothetical protein
MSLGRVVSRNREQISRAAVFFAKYAPGKLQLASLRQVDFPGATQKCSRPDIITLFEIPTCSQRLCQPPGSSQTVNFHYPIEIRYNTCYDRKLNKWFQKYLYKKLWLEN